MASKLRVAFHILWHVWRISGQKHSLSLDKCWLNNMVRLLFFTWATYRLKRRTAAEIDTALWTMAEAANCSSDWKNALIDRYTYSMTYSMRASRRTSKILRFLMFHSLTYYVCDHDYLRPSIMAGQVPSINLLFPLSTIIMCNMHVLSSGCWAQSFFRTLWTVVAYAILLAYVSLYRHDVWSMAPWLVFAHFRCWLVKRISCASIVPGRTSLCSIKYPKCLKREWPYILTMYQWPVTIS